MTFPNAVYKFNDMYDLPNGATPDLHAVGNPVERLLNFGKIMREELDESAEIIAHINEGGSDIDALVGLADWLGDIMIYAASEMRRYGLPQTAVLKIIMESNFSKLGADGLPIVDERGKVMKGPGYWRPEPKLKDLIVNILADACMKESL